MDGNNGRVSVITVGYNHRHFLADCVRALERAAAGVQARLILVDNASSDGTAEFVRQELLLGDGKATKGGMPCLFLDNKDNKGFAGGNNQAMEIALKDGDEFVYLLNPDTEAEPGFLAKAVEVMRQYHSTGIVQSLLRLHPKKELVNTWGNEIHFLGFGYAGGEGVALDAPETKEKLKIRDVAYASGAGMLVRTALLKEIGMLDEELFAYHEDLEFSWRARLAGHRVLLAPESVVFHKYEFSRSIKKYYWMERNRFLVMEWCYRWPTYLLILPALAVMEVGLWIFAFRSGWWREKARAWGYLLDPKNGLKSMATRRKIQRLRKISDREATALFTGEILFQQMQPALLTRVANPLFSLYWKLVRLIMFW
jgi:GT2 family glycosyltransferase